MGGDKWKKKNQQVKQNQWPEEEGEIEVQKLNGKGLSKQGVLNNLNYYIKVKKSAHQEVQWVLPQPSLISHPHYHG